MIGKNNNNIHDKKRIINEILFNKIRKIEQ